MPTPFEPSRKTGSGPQNEKAGRSVFSNFKVEDAAESPFPSPWREGRGEGQGTVVRSDADESGIDLAVARSFFYRFLAAAFEIPNAETWRWLCNATTHNALRAGAGQALETEADQPSPAAEELTAHLTVEQFEAFESAYYVAFGHTVRGDCPMNEIEYGDIKADPLFQPHRLADLGAFYRAFGLAVAGDAAERQDHICLELELMAVLSAKEAYASQEVSGAEMLAICREAQKKFLREHLGRWTPAFTRRLAATAGPGVLAALADFTREFVVSDCRRFGVPPGSEDLLLRPVDEAAETLCHSCGINQLPPGAAVPAGS